MRWILSLILQALAIITAGYLFDGFYIESFWVAIIAAVILTLLNAIVKPILVILTLPITILTLGLFMFIINAITLMLAQAIIGSGFVIESFGLAILASIVISFINMVLQKGLND
ncbi:putative membrane protein YvlD [Halolactibacillus miurensis]|uniref:Membrane protein YvlD n=1 Tax=Halolactibacillus miurensis TaxID=306541 RepID=A0A1I6RIN0_9BACI|nr:MULTISPECIES: phage holin family protein [Halolactibacillus]GEM03922.1 putative membrane protein YvlD [Halolactibacillus miurensis]SFS64494.1 putative membrane protein [Halolactibacillus miurensis]